MKISTLITKLQEYSPDCEVSTYDNFLIIKDGNMEVDWFNTADD